MTADYTDTELKPQALALGVRAHRGGAPASDAPAFDTIDSDYGRRIESDRSWTVYHVFTGAPARIEGQTMMGLSRTEATERMLSLNQSNLRRRRERGVQPPPVSTSLQEARQP
jgi:hypothetical protein